MFKQNRELIERYYEISDLLNDPYTYYRQFWIISKWNFIFQKEVENIITKFSWSYGVWTYIRIKSTLNHSYSKGKNIGDYVYDYLQTMPKESQDGNILSKLEELISKLNPNDDDHVDFGTLKFAKEELLKLTEQLSDLTKRQFKSR